MGETENKTDALGDSCVEKDIPSQYQARVLIADDEPGNQKLTEIHLCRLGLHVTAVDNGQQVIDTAMSQKFDMIFMDMQMPVIDGFKATTHLRQKGMNVPIIALTAYAFDGDRQRCIAAGCDDYISKPVDSDIMKSMVEKHCRKTVNAQ